MKKSFILALCILLATVIFAMGVSPQAVDGESKELLDAAIAGETEMYKMGVVPVDALCEQIKARSLSPNADLYTAVDMVKEQQAAESIDMSDYYMGSLASQYQEIADDAQKNFSIDEFGMDVDSGVLQPCLLDTEELSETERKIKYSYVSWRTTIRRQDGGYMVWIMFNQDVVEAVLREEDGEWKIFSYESDDKRFEPEGYDPNQGVYPTLEEALQKVQNTNITMLNPYKFS